MGERLPFGGPLHLKILPRAIHHNVDIHPGFKILNIVQIKQGLAFDQTHAHGCDR